MHLIISNTFPFFPDFFPECSGPLGIEGGIISNQQITASSTHRALFGLQKWYPYYARLNKKGLINAWTAAENDRWPWIQVTIGWDKVITQMTRSFMKVDKGKFIVTLNHIRGEANLVKGQTATNSKNMTNKHILKGLKILKFLGCKYII